MQQIDITEALFGAIARAKELLAQDSVTELERDSLVAHLEYIRLKADQISEATSLLDVNIEDVVVQTPVISTEETPEE
jgi:hypothetical protein